MIHLIAFIYVSLFRWRERIFGHVAEFDYLPSAYDRTKFPVALDHLWIGRGFWGRGVFYVPTGKNFSARFDANSEYFQSWIGSYYITLRQNMSFRSELEKVSFLAQAAVNDQKSWLKAFGIENPIAEVVEPAIRKTKFEGIYSGEILTSVEDSTLKRKTPWVLSRVTDKVAEYYNNQAPSISLRLDGSISRDKQVRLFGYFRIEQISLRKYIVIYGCVTKNQPAKVKAEVMNSVQKCVVRVLDRDSES